MKRKEHSKDAGPVIEPEELEVSKKKSKKPKKFHLEDSQQSSSMFDSNEI